MKGKIPKSGRAERRASRNAASASIVVLLALVMLAVGLGGGFLLTRSRIPSSLISSTAAGTVQVSAAPFDDARSVSLTVSLGSSSTVAAPKGGMVTASACAPGGVISSGGSLMELDAVPVLVLHTQTPLYRTLTSGTSGADALALNQALRSLGYGAPDSDWMTWDTVAAYNALAATIGARQLVAADNWAIGPDSFMWLPADSLGIASCSVAVGQRIEPGAAAFASAATPVKATLPADSSGVVAGDRTLDINGQTFDVPAGTTELTDGALLSAIAASNEYRVAMLTGGVGGSGGASGGDASGAPSGASAGGSINISYTWKLKTPIDAITVPPSAVIQAADGVGCVASEGKSVPVRIISSQLGKTMVAPENDAAITTVEVKPASAKPCR